MLSKLNSQMVEQLWSKQSVSRTSLAYMKQHNFMAVYLYCTAMKRGLLRFTDKPADLLDLGAGGDEASGNDEASASDEADD